MSAVRQPPGAERCFLCSSPEVSPEAHYGSPVCDGCLPIKDHVVAMSNDAGKSIAVCRCGWRSETAWRHRGTVQAAKVRLHWREVIRRKAAELDAIDRNPGGAARDLRTGAIVIALLAFNLVGWLVVAGAGVAP